jgi:hypothetical protein
MKRWPSIDRAMLVIGGACVLAGCTAVPSDSDRIVTSLRVLGVRSEPASVPAGGSSELSLLCADGSPGNPDRPACNVQVAWFSGCHNPEGARPLSCLDRYAAIAKSLGEPVSATFQDPSLADGFGFGNRFVFHAPPSILTQEADLGRMRLRFGISFVFFAVCAGTLHRVLGTQGRLPVECRNDATGTVLGQDRFVVGHTTVYSYDWLENDNPVITSRWFDGKAMADEWCGVDSDCGAASICKDGTCAPRVSACGRGAGSDCREHTFEIRISPDSFAVRPTVAAPADLLSKRVWVDYYATGGSVGDGRVPLDAGDGGTSSPMRWVPPAASDAEARIWAVVRDERGGLAWVEQRIIIE